MTKIIKEEKYESNLDFLGFPNHFITVDGKLFNNCGKQLKPYIMKKGYHKFELRYNYKSKVYFAHQLVALAFIPNPNNYDTVDHIDNNTQNNHISNLQWLSKSDNSKKGWENGNHDHQKKTVLQLLDGKIVNKYNSIQEASRRFGVHFSNISRACNTGRKCKGYEWKFSKE